MYLSSSEQAIIDWILHWTIRMTNKHGGIVYDKNGTKLDWGQALARECYGEKWIEKVPETPTQSDVKKAEKWEKGIIPEWVDQERMRKQLIR